MNPKAAAERILELDEYLASLRKNGWNYNDVQPHCANITQHAPQIARRYLEAIELLRKAEDEIHGEFCGSTEWPLCAEIEKFIAEHEGKK